MLHGNAKGYCKLIMERFRAIGYNAQLFLVNAADCGVPQKRERVFFIALRDDIDKPKLVLAPEHRWISAGEATSDVQVLTDDEIKNTKPSNLDLKYWHKCGKSKSYSDVHIKEGGKGSYFSHYRLDNRKESNTLKATDTFTHWNICRSLTYREWKRLGSFPDNYQAKTDKIGKYMIGMSVPPKMMQKVAEAVISQWF